MSARDAAPIIRLFGDEPEDPDARVRREKSFEYLLGRDDGYLEAEADAAGTFSLGAGLIWAAAGATLPTVVLSLLRAEEVARVLVRSGVCW